jgi:deazaflavin-dependent oxidoreductase (nitroreductase family)
VSEESGSSLVERIFTPIIASRPASWFYVNVAPTIDRLLLRLTRGRLTTVGRHRVGFLRVTGAATGVERVTPLAYTRDGENIILVASRGGDTRHPAWYRNVVANPNVRFLIDGVERAYSARELEGPARERAWRLVVRRYAGYAVYQHRAGDRRIPLVALTPLDA